MYVYRFINSSNEVVYIGKATDLENRMSKHNHLSEECYKEIVKIQYIKLSNNDESSIYERYLINKHSPKYNTQYSNKSSFSFELPEKEWKDYNNRGDLDIKLKENKEEYIDLYNSCCIYKNIEDVFSLLCYMKNKAIVTMTEKDYKISKLNFYGDMLSTESGACILLLFNKNIPIINYNKKDNYVMIYFSDRCFIKMYIEEFRFVGTLEGLINQEFEHVNMEYSDDYDTNFRHKHSSLDVIRDWKTHYNYYLSTPTL